MVYRLSCCSFQSVLVIDSISLSVTLYRWFFSNSIHFLSDCILYLCIVNSLRIVYVSGDDDELFSLQSIFGISICGYFGVLLVLLHLYINCSQRVMYYGDDRVVVCCNDSSCIDCWWCMSYLPSPSNPYSILIYDPMHWLSIVTRYW